MWALKINCKLIFPLLTVTVFAVFTLLNPTKEAKIFDLATHLSFTLSKTSLLLANAASRLLDFKGLSAGCLEHNHRIAEEILEH